MITTSNWSPTLASARLSAYSRPARINSIASAPARSMLAGSSVIPSDVSHQRGVRFHVAEQHLVDRHGQLVRILTERERQTALRVQIDEQYPSALLRHRRTQRRHRRRFGNPTLLIGDR